MDMVTKDLISKLIEIDPLKRLGIGPDGKENYDTLKAHDFFKNIDFEKI